MVPIRVLIADDHTLFRAGIISLLRDEPDIEVVGEASNGEQALSAARELEPAVILMDLRMPQLGGVEATQSILTALPETQILMLTFSDDDEDLYAAIKAGARGYLLKNADPEDLFKAIRQVQAGEVALSPAVARCLLDTVRDAVPAMIGLQRLTRREQEVFRLLAHSASNHQIAETLMISEHTVKAHVKHILAKLNLHSRSQTTAYTPYVKSLR